MKFHTTWKFHCDTLQFICFKSDFLCSLAVAIYISCHICIRKTHIYIWNLRLWNTVIIQFHCKCLCCTACTGKGRISTISIRCCQMYQNKSGTCTQVSISIFLCEKSFITRSLCAIVTNLCQLLTITELCNIISTTSRTGFRRLHTICCCRNITKLNRIFVSQITSIPVIRILITGSSCYCNFLGTLCCNVCCHESNRFSFFHRIKGDAVLRCLIHYFWNSQTGFFICRHFLVICKICYNLFCPIRISILRISGIFCFTGISFTSCIFRRTLCLCFCFRLFYCNISAYSVSWVTADWLYCIDSFVGIRCMYVKICTSFTFCFME